MYHLYPSAKGDPLCPLGFHPQVRWPTRCKRCFRDYKEHVGKKVERESNLHKNTVSTPSLSSIPSDKKLDSRSWVSTNNLGPEENSQPEDGYRPPSSWISTPDLVNIKDDTQSITTVNMHLPKRQMKSTDTSQNTDNPTLLKIKGSVFNKSDSLATRAQKLQSMKDSSSSSGSGKRIQVKEVKTISEEATNHDVEFLIHVKTKPKKDQPYNNSDVDDLVSLAGTETTDTTLVDTDANEIRDQLESLKNELEITKMKCNRLEREKSDILLRRLAAMETTTSKTTASEVLKLQQKCNEMQHQLEDYRDEKKSLLLKVKELEQDLEVKTANQQAPKIADELRAKLLATETLCEELMDENEDIKKELRDMETQMEELQDNFREDQANEYTSIKKDLDQTTKNCRILSFKLRKSERKLAQMEMEKEELEKKLKEVLDSGTDIAKSKQEQKLFNKHLVNLEKLPGEAKSITSKAGGTNGPTNEKATRESNGENTPVDKNISRYTLTRGGSQEDPAQLLRDLQDSLEREADLREQLKFAEEEAQTLQKKVSRIEDDNESLLLQLKKMAARTKTYKASPSESQGRDEMYDDDATEMKLQLEMSEQEALVLRGKVEELESENRDLKVKVKEIQERLTVKNRKRPFLSGEKTKEKSLAKPKKKVSENENNVAPKELLQNELSITHKTMQKSKSQDLNQQNSDLQVKDEATEETEQNNNIFRKRIPKKITALTTKEQLKLMIRDLEKDIEDILLAMRKSENEYKNLQEVDFRMKKCMTEFDTLNEKYNSTLRNLDEEKQKCREICETNREMNETINRLKESFKNTVNEKSVLQSGIEKLNKENLELINEKRVLIEEAFDLKAKLKLLNAKQDEINSLQQKMYTMKVSLGNKDEEIRELKEAQTKLINENSKKDQTILELGLQTTNLENKCMIYEEKLQEQNKYFEKKIDQQQGTINTLKSNQAECNDNLNVRIRNLEEDIERKNEVIKQLESDLEKRKEINSVKLENEELNMASEKLLKTQMELKNIKLENQRQIKQMEIDLQNERKKLVITQSNNEKERKNRELELSVLREKIKHSERNSLEASDIKKLKISISELECALAQERRKYDELTAKYEMLEEEHVMTKAKLVMEKEAMESQNKQLKNSMEKLDEELKTLKESYDEKQKIWIREKLEVEDKLKGISHGDASNRQRLKVLLQEKQSEYDHLKKIYNDIQDQVEFMRRENDDLKKKLDDYEKVNKVQRNISADNSAMETEMKKLQVRLNNVEKSKKASLAELKIRYEGQINTMNTELHSLQNQLFRFKREKDTYKHMLETAQKTIGEYNQSHKNSRPGSENVTYDELKEYKSKIAALEEQISCMEDEFSEAKLECSKLKTELVSERSSWEVKISELHSKINELEEEKVLSSGRTKIVGLRTKMELAWQKEREEQQRLLQETATLARDLRQTLFEVERERDKERLEARRKLDHVKKMTEEEQEQNKKKLIELQCELLELGNAHAKLRTMNEKLKSEKIVFDKEKSQSSCKKCSDRENDTRIHYLIEQMDRLKQLAPELFFSKNNDGCYTPNPPRRTKSKSRESSPAIEIREFSMVPEEKQQQIQNIMQGLVHTTEDLRQLPRKSDDDLANVKKKRSMGIRRATSLEHDEGSSSTYQPQQVNKSVIFGSSLKRKSLSLEHTMRNEQSIWTNDSKTSSRNSLESHSDIESSRMGRDMAPDSRLSSGSTQSELGDKKKKKGIMGKIKKLTKSRSVDDQDPGIFSPTRSISSKKDSHGEAKGDSSGSKKDLRGRISEIFKKSGSSSRSNSVERRQETSSTQRPLVRNRSNGNLTPNDV